MKVGDLNKGWVLPATSVLLIVAGTVNAQSAASNAEDQELSEVVVTGSNIRMSGFDALVPLQVTSREDIEQSGVANFSDVFKDIPGNAGSELYNEASPRAGQSQFNLRGLGYSSTLTLVNGRRAGVTPLSDEAGAEYVDVNQFPLAMVERVEVLKDGASAIYGSDAVAGVVNVITRRGFEGFEVSGGFQDATNRTSFVNIASGRKFDGGTFNFYATYYDQTGNDRTDFDWLVERVHGNGVLGRSQLLNATASPSTYRIGGLNANGDPIGLANGVAFADPDCEAAGGVFRIRDNGTVDRSACLHNFADQVGIIPAATRLQVFTEVSFALGERTTFSAEASFSRNVLETTKGPGAYSNGTVVANSPGSVYIPASHPFNFFVRDPANPLRLQYIAPEQWNSAVNSAVDVIASLRPLGVAYNGDGAGKRRSQTDYPRFVGAFDFDLGHQWSARTAYQYAGADFTDQQPMRYRADALNELIATGRFNPFGTAVANPTLASPKDGASVAGNTEEVINQFLADSTDTARTEQHVVDVVASGKAFSIGGNEVGLAVGAQFRQLTLDSVPDSLQASGGGDTPSAPLSQSGEQEVKAAYAEVALPIGTIASTQFAARYEDYGRFGSTLDPKVAGNVKLGERVSLRGSWGTSFQAPTLFQTSTSITRLFVNDPVSDVGGSLVCRNTGVTSNARITTLGALDLDPQRSTNFNLGVVFAPLDQAQVSLDYWNYRYRDLIAQDANPQSIIDRDCSDGVPNDPRIERDGAGIIVGVTSTFVNIGKVETDGVDFAGTLRWELDSLGSLVATTDATWLRRFDVVGGDGGAFNGAGSRNFANNFRSMPRWRGVTGLRWSRGPQSAGVKVRYIGSYTNDQSNNAKIDDFMPVDLSYGFTFSGGGESESTVLVGADNVFDRDPPGLVRNTAAGVPVTGTVSDFDRPGYDAYAGHDIRGRVLYIRAVHKF